MVGFHSALFATRDSYLRKSLKLGIIKKNVINVISLMQFDIPESLNSGCKCLDLMVTLICRNSTGRNFYCEESNYTTGNYLRLFRKAVQCHPFSKISPEKTGGGALLLVKLQTDCSE